MPASRLLCLVVEDDALVRWATCDILESRGYDVISAPDADEAIRILESRGDIRFLVTDIEMPGSMDGIKLAAAVRAKWPPIHIVVVSGRVKLLDADLPERGVFLSKPYDHDRLCEVLAAF